MARFRFTLRRMMMVTAYIAVVLGLASILWNGRRDAIRRNLFLEKSERHRMTADNHIIPQSDGWKRRKAAEETELVLRRTTASPDWLAKDIGKLDALIRSMDARAMYHLDMSRKYQKAAEHPRDAIAPDPPEPQEVEYRPND